MVVKRLNRGDLNDPVINDRLTISIKPTTQYIRYASQLTEYNQESIIIKPTIRNFSAVDLILTPNCIFQITVSPKHPVKQGELINISQSYVTPKKKIGNDLEAFQAVKRKSAILNNVEQWVVKIKMTPEMTNVCAE
ncbi:10305_t:CDS:2 [Acaulospora morrowiae]|uniref:10305_t:CDS:1 n=1 Tax=Acaulospora morrowiae TaxID=94023 RepID=A0A9N9G6S0_9GLOM|nr:10305_t:CDS:2 [Acaulospora morrowiae]